MAEPRLLVDMASERRAGGGSRVMKAEAALVTAGSFSAMIWGGRC